MLSGSRHYDMASNGTPLGAISEHVSQGNGISRRLHEVDVVEVSQDWAGIDNLVTNSDLSSIQAPRRTGQRPWVQMPYVGGDKVLPEAKPNATNHLNGGTNRPETKIQSPFLWSFCCHARFIIVICLYIADFVMRTWTLVICFRHGAFEYVRLLAPLQILGALLSGYITFHDADVLLWLHNVSTERWIVRASIVSFVLCIFSCLQMIEVKRAWSRQLHVVEIVNDMGDVSTVDLENTRTAVFESIHRYGGSERVLPVALFTGVPYLIIVSLIMQREVWAAWARGADGVMSLSMGAAVGTVSLSIIEMDIAVSAYLLRKYHYNPLRKGFCHGQAQCLYALCHTFFRACEVFVRVFVISTLLDVTNNKLGESLMLVVLLTDYMAGVVLLKRRARSEEHIWVHMAVGVALLVADLTHFVDKPTFAEPARFISMWLSTWRYLCLILVLIISVDVGYSRAPTTFFGWEFRNFTILVFAIFYLALRLSPTIRIVGQDLHTATRAGNLDQVESMLKADSDGQVLDVNARTRDSRQVTPAMLAAKGGHDDILDCLVAHGAELDVQCSSGNTCLHYAAEQLHLQTCQRLLKLGVDSRIRNEKGLRPQDMVSRRICCSSKLRCEIAEMLAAHSGCTTPRITRKRKIYSVSAEPCELPLHELFPEIAGCDDQLPAPHALHSVSGLIASRSAGVLARRILAPVNPPIALPLGALRRVRDLGMGGFGRVIEVELPYRAWDNLPWRGARPRHFAMKIQPKNKSRQTAASEVLALQRVRHPFIVRLERAFATNNFFALVLELCPTDLNRILCEKRSSEQCLGLPSERAARYMGQILLALVHLHEIESIVYRDVKPENILISDGDDAKLTDFGLAERAADGIHRKKSGTYGFLAPELGESGPDSMCGSSFSSDGIGQPYRDMFKMDSYSFGITLQLVLLGEYAGQIKDIHRKGLVMLPLAMTESERYDLLRRFTDEGILNADAFALLVDNLLSSSGRRSCLQDPEVINHPFFLQALGCVNLKSYLLSERRPPSPGNDRNRNRSRSSSSGKSVLTDDGRRVPLLAGNV